MSPWLKALRDRDEFRPAMRELKDALRPIIPRYKPMPTKDEEEALVARIKFETARQDGFDLLMMHLTGERE